MQGIIDIHNHILPGLDDGAGNLQEAARMCLLAVSEGIRTIVATPHYHLGIQAAGPEKREQALQLLEEEIERLGLKLEIYRGNEIYYSPQAMEDLKEKKARTMGSGKYILMEFSPKAEYSYIRQGIGFAVSEGYRPIIAHAERYGEIAKDKDCVSELIEMGGYIQINASGVLGTSGRKIKRICREMLKDELVHFVATDAHDLKKRAPRIQKCADYIITKYGAAYGKRLLIDNPRKMLWDEYL